VDRRLPLPLARRTALLFGATLARPALAQGAFPDRPLRIVVPFSAGGGTDVAAREIARRMSETLGQPIVVENRTGGNSAIGAEYVARSRPDGHTLFFTSGTTMVVAPLVWRHLPYKPEDFAPVGLVLKQYFSLAVAPRVASSVPELIEKLKERPGAMSFGHTGTGGVGHLLAERLMAATGTRMLSVPYRGFQQTVVDMLAGRLEMTFEGVHNIVPFHRDGTLRILALTSDRRAPQLPDVPTFAEAGQPGMSVDAWLALFAPAGTPAPIIAALNRALVAAVDSPSFREHAAGQVQLAQSSTPEALAASIARETADWRRVIEPLNLRVD
jgi:tripartite-type tricarboxylate transporter receptor subunit TctC